MELKIILVVALVLIGSHLFLWSFIKRKLREAETRIAKEKNGDGGVSQGGDSSADCGGGDGGGCD